MYHVLYVDDEPDLLEIAKVFLESSREFIVDTATSAQEILNEQDLSEYDAIISDYQMPEMDGITFLKEVRARFGTVPFILFTGRGREEVVIEAINSGADFYLQKGGEPGAQFAELSHKIRSAASKKRAENALRRSEEKYRYLIEHSHEAIVVGQEEMLRLVNHRTVEFTGYSEEELMSMPFSAFIHPDDRSMVMEQYRRRMKGGENPPRYTFRLRQKDGSTRWVEMSGLATDWEGTPATLNFLTDITEQKRAEEALMDREEQYRNLLSQLPDSVMVYQDGLIVYANQTAAEKTGYSQEELIGSHLEDYLVPEDQGIVGQMMRMRSAGEEISDYEFDMLHRSGTLHHIIARTSSIVFNQIPSVAIILVDITERKQVEMAIIASENLYRTIFETTGAATILVEHDTTIIRANSEFARLSGFSSEELEGKKNWTEFAVPDDIEHMRQHHRDLWNSPTGGARAYEFRFINRYGEVRHCINNVSIVPGTSQSVASVVDITERRQAESELETKHRELMASFEHLTAVEEKLKKQFDVLVESEQITRLSEERLIMAEAIGHTGCWEYHITNDTIWGSAEGLRLFGFPPVAGEYPIDAIEACIFERERVHQALVDLLAEGADYNLEYTITPADGSAPRVIHSLARVEKNVQGRPLWVRGVILDITERKQQELELRESKQKLTDIITFLPDATLVIDRDGTVIAWNRAMEEMTSIPADAMMGRGNYEYALPFYHKRRPIIIDLALHDDPAVAVQYPAIQKRGRSLVSEIAIPHFKEGRGAHLWFMASPLYDTDGNLTGAIESIRDITDRTQAEEALQEREEQYRLLIENSYDIIYTLTPEGVFSFVSPSWTVLLGHQVDQVIGRSFRQFVHPDDIPRCQEFLLHSIEGRKRQKEIEYRVLHADGSWRWNISKSVPLSDRTGTIAGIEGIASDITERKRADEALKESEERYKHISDTMTDFVFSCIKPDGGNYTIDWMAGAVERITGYSIRELQALGCWRCLVHPDDMSIFDEQITGFPGERSSDCILRIQTKQGTVRWLSVSTVHVLSQDASSFNRVFGGCRDITERKLAEEALQENSRKYAELFELGSEATFLIDNETGALLEVNSAACELYGYPRETLLTMKNTDLSVEQEMTRKVTTETPQGTIRVPLRYHRRKDGTVFPVEILGRFFTWNGRSVHIASIRDITDRMHIEEALRESEEHLRLVSDNLTSGIVIVDAETHTIDLVNPMAAALFGTDGAQILGKRCHQFLCPAQEGACPITDLHQEVDNAERQILRTDGAMIPVLKSVKRTRIGGREKLLENFIEISDRKRAEEALSHMNRKLTLLSGITRHDINNQLTILRGHLEMFEDSLSDPGLNERFQCITSAVEQISAMIQFTKEYEQIGINAPVWQDCRTLVETAAKQTTLNGIVVKNDLLPDKEVFADPLIVKVCYNLMDNAARYAGVGATVQFSDQIRGDELIMVCEDDGIGIPEGEEERIFERGVGRNTGLGLAISREILDITGITIRELGEPGRGARFEMTVPKGMWRIRRICR